MAAKLSETSTRSRILMTAMSLFARDGIKGVTLRKISADSGSANTAAVHYHFKDRTGLIAAIIEFLTEHVWEPGYEGLEQAVEQKVPLRELIAIGLWPSKQISWEFPWGGEAQAFMFHVVTGSDERGRELLSRMASRHDELFERALRDALSDLPQAVFEQRLQFMQTEAVAGQHVRARMLKTTPVDDWTKDKERQYFSRYIDYVVGGLTAPVTE